jgi:hypothetical protein
MPQLFVFLARDQRLDAVLSKPVPHAVVAVALVARQSLRPLAWPSQRLRDRDLVHHRLNARRLVRPAGGHFNRQRQASTVSNQVEIAAESASRAAQSVVFRLFPMATAAFLEAPAAARLARTDEPSMHHRSQSIVPSASSRMCRADRFQTEPRSHPAYVYCRIIAGVDLSAHERREFNKAVDAQPRGLSPAVRLKPGGRGHSLSGSPPAIDAMPAKTSLRIVSVTNRTDPSANTTCTPPR